MSYGFAAWPSSVCLGPLPCFLFMQVLQQARLLWQSALPSKSFCWRMVLREPLLSEAESLLGLARSTLKERRYEESILAARNAYQRMVEQ
jgi:hypothetical protein